MATSYNLTHKIAGDWINIGVKGRIDSSNAEDFSDRVLSLQANLPHKRVELDFSELEYISSAGLRVLLKLQKNEKEKIKITEAVETVYKVLDSTGFNRIFDVRAKVREFPVDGLEEIARGATGVVYRVDDDTILKLYSPGNPISFAEEEQMKAKNALIAGVPTAISYEIVKCAGSYGVVFEMVKADTAAAIIMADSKENVPMWGRKLGALMKEIHSCTADPSQTTSIKDIYRNRLMTLGDYISAEQISRAVNALDRIPDRLNMIHGDFHTRNIMMQDGEFLLIDMIDSGYGHPIFDLSMNFISSRNVPSDAPRLVGISEDRVIPLWENLIKEYFGIESEQEIERRRKVIAACSCPRYLCFPAFIPEMLEDTKWGLVKTGLEFLPEFEKTVDHIDEIF